MYSKAFSALNFKTNGRSFIRIGYKATNLKKLFKTKGDTDNINKCSLFLALILISLSNIFLESL